MIFFHFKLL